MKRHQSIELLFPGNSSPRARVLPAVELDVSKTTAISSVEARLKTLCWIVCCLGLLAAPPAVRAQISWSTPGNITGDTDVLTNGAVSYAYNWGGIGSTVNGVTFTAENSTTGSSDGNVTCAFDYYIAAAFTTTLDPYAALSTAYQDILQGGLESAATSETVTLNNLVSGHPYLAQFWANDPRFCCGDRYETISSAGGDSVVLAYSATETAGVPGQYAVGYFIASGTSQALTLNANVTCHITALQVRDLTSTNAGVINWIGPVDIAGDTDVLTTGAVSYAYNWGGIGSTVNGVTFTAENSTTGSSDGNVTCAFDYYIAAAFTTTLDPYAALSTAYQDILQGGLESAATSETVTLNNLVSGHPYLAQFWANDPRFCCGDRYETISSAGGDSVVLAYSATETAGVPGQYAVGYFIASGTSQALTLNANVTCHITALQVRDLTSGVLALASYTAAQNVYAGNSAVFAVNVVPGSSPAYQWQFVNGGVTNNLTNGPTGTGSTIFGVTINTLMVSNVSSADTGYLYTCLITNSASSTNSPAAPLTLLVSTNMLVTQPGDPITDFTTAIGMAANDAAGLGAANITDGTLAPYLNYGANAQGNPFAGPVGFVVTPNFGGSIITAARIYTSANAQADDPADFTLYGSNDGVEWFFIVYEPLALPSARNALGGTINANNQVLQEIDFPNTNAYYSYAVYFTNAFGGVNATNGLELAEVQLLGVHSGAPEIVTEPVSQELPVGGMATLSVGLNDVAGPYGYQWRGGAHNSGLFTNLIAGGQFSAVTNATCYITNVTLANAGDYDVVVTNGFGTTTSTVAVLTVATNRRVIASAYQNAILADGPTSYWPLNETNGPFVYDIMGTNYGTMMVGTDSADGYGGHSVFAMNDGSAFGMGGPGALYGVSGDTAIYFTNANGADIVVPYSPALDGATFTVEGWLNLPASPAGVPFGFDYNGWIGNFVTPVCTGWWLNVGAVPYIAMVGKNSAGWSDISPAESPVNQWVYFAMSYDGSTINVYQQGNLIGSVSATYAQVITSGAPIPLVMGALSLDPPYEPVGTVYNYYQGGLEQVAVYPYALTEGQVLNHYNIGAFGSSLAPSFSATGQPVGFTNYVGYSNALSVVAAGTAPIYYQWYKNSVPISSATSPALDFSHLQLTDAASYTVTVSNTLGSVTSSIAGVMVLPLPTNAYQATVISEFPDAYYPLDETSGTNAYDIIGTGDNEGTYINSPLLGQPGPSSYAGTSVTLDGASQGVLVNDTLTMPIIGHITLEAWVLVQETNADQVIIGHGPGSLHTGTMAYDALGITTESSFTGNTNGDGFYYIGRYQEVGNKYSSAYYPVPAADVGSWVHLVGVADGTAWRLYRNGVQVASTADTVGAIASGGNGSGWAIGAFNAVFETPPLQAPFFDGSINNVGIYDYALTPGMIQQHYQIGTTGMGVNSTPATLTIQLSATNVVVDWNYGFLQQSASVNGPWTYVSGAVSPYTFGVTNSAVALYFRATLVPSGSPSAP
jgi:hypothetical protein